MTVVKRLSGAAENVQLSRRVSIDKLQNYSKSSADPKRIKCNLRNETQCNNAQRQWAVLWSSLSASCVRFTRREQKERDRSHIDFQQAAAPVNDDFWAIELAGSLASDHFSQTSIFIKLKRLICDQQKGSEPVGPRRALGAASSFNWMCYDQEFIRFFFVRIDVSRAHALVKTRSRIIIMCEVSLKSNNTEIFFNSLNVFFVIFFVLFMARSDDDVL